MTAERNALSALSAVDGRYHKTGAKLSPFFSELALIHYRIYMQVQYLIALSEDEEVPLRKFTDEERAILFTLSLTFPEDVEVIKAIETTGYAGIKATKHDVVAVITYLREKLKGTTLADVVEWVHFGLTSEDCNNISYALMLRDVVRGVLYPSMKHIVETLDELAGQYASVPMLARTHGQPATPTTLGKELRVFHERLRRQLEQLENFKILVKLNGASGNYCAHVAALPEIDWHSFAEDFILSFNEVSSFNEEGAGPLEFERNPLTTQIEPHDTYAELFQIFTRFNTILIDLSQDLWRYVSDGWLVQKAVEGEVGSSAMPHKVNPIDLENAEGNFGFANAMLEFFCRKLPISRLQRDLSDSTVERNFGLALGHCLIGYEAILRGMGKISANEKAIAEALDESPEVLAEAYQTILRAAGYADAYSMLKELTRGREINRRHLRDFVDTIRVPDEVRAQLMALDPSNYVGLAAELARE